MALIERNQAPAPVLPKETVQVDALGGEVIVRGLLLSERLALSAEQAGLLASQDGESSAPARMRAGAQMVPRTLAACVILADGQPMWTADEWDRFGAAHAEPAFELFAVAQRLSGLDAKESEKN